MKDSNMSNGRRVVTDWDILHTVAEQVVADFRAVQDGMLNPKYLKMSVEKLARTLEEVKK